jgi:hypothetical protein
VQRATKLTHRTQESNIERRSGCLRGMSFLLLALVYCVLAGTKQGNAQDNTPDQNSAGYVPVLSGAFAYIQNSSGGVQSLAPQINPVLLVPMAKSVLLESHVDFTGFFQRRNRTSGDFTGEVFKTIESAQLDWLADSHLVAVGGRFLLPFGLYSERLTPVWIHNLQDVPLTYAIGTHPYGSADGLMLRGVAASLPPVSFQYSAYFSTHCSIDQLAAVRAAGGDGSMFFPTARVETGLSYQRTLEGYQINNEAAYLTWQPQSFQIDLKAEYDRNHYGDGYWIEAAHSPQRFFVAPQFVRRFQLVGRMEQFFVRNGGGHGLSTVGEKRPEIGLNYLIRDDWKLISSYGRLFSPNGNSNSWNFGFTYRFIWPLWPGKRS